MPKLTIDDLKAIKEKHKATFALREGGYGQRLQSIWGRVELQQGQGMS